jgi:hypothetical protein
MRRIGCAFFGGNTAVQWARAMGPKGKVFRQNPPQMPLKTRVALKCREAQK